MMRCCAAKTYAFTMAFAIGAAGWAVFQSRAEIQVCSFEEDERPAAEETKLSEVDMRLLETLGKLHEKELERLVKAKKLTAKRADEIRSDANGADKERNDLRTIALIEAGCRRSDLSPFQCLGKKEATIFDIKYNMLPRYDSFTDAAGYNKWRMKRKLRKAPAEVLFDENAGLGRM